MSLDLEDVQRIAHLARIAISDEEAHQVLIQLNSIFALVEELRAVNTESVEPMFHAQEVFQRLRNDEPAEIDLHGKYQSIAPHVEADLYLVPRVIE